MDAAARLEPIPHPPGHVFVGNLFDLDASHPVESLMDLARKVRAYLRTRGARQRLARHRVEPRAG